MKLTLASATLAALIAQTYPSISGDKTRPTLCCILFASDGATLRLVATDTHRLSTAVHAVGGDAFEFMLALADVRAVKKILRKRGDCTIESEADLVAFTTPTGSHICEPVAGTFPNWARVVPAASALEILCDKAQLLAAFTDLMAHKPCSDRCTVEMIDGCLFAGARYNTPQGGYASTSAVCEAAWTRNDGALAEFTFAVNGRFMLDAAKSTDADTLRLRFQAGSLRPILMDACDDAAGFHLLMPMSIQ